jgi:hypothetical protein
VGYNSVHQGANCPEADPSDDGYTFCFGGTSAATPLTAGYDARGFSSGHGFGRVNAHAAVKAAIAARGAFAGGQGSAVQP